MAASQKCQLKKHSIPRHNFLAVLRSATIPPHRPFVKRQIGKYCMKFSLSSQLAPLTSPLRFRCGAVSWRIRNSASRRITTSLHHHRNKSKLIANNHREIQSIAIMSYPAILLRAEQKPLEHRSFSPAVIKTLIDAGYPISVERSSTDPNFKRIFEDSEYEAAGATLVPSGVWPDAAPGTIVLGLKEIPEEDFPLKNDQ